MAKTNIPKHFNDDNSIFLPQLNFRTILIDQQDEHLHSHDFIEFFYIISGSISHSCCNETKKLTTGDAVLIFPNVKHQFKRFEPCLYRNFCITVNEFKKCCDFLGDEVFKAVSDNVYAIIKIPSFTIDFLESQIKYLSKNLSNEQAAISKIKMLIAVTINLFLGENNVGKLSNNLASTVHAPQWLYRFLTLFDKYDIIKYGVPELKKHIFYSYSYVCRSFKKYMGKTLLTHLNEIRLEHSKYLLRNTNYSILEIANNIGFSSVGYYNRLFKKYYHTTPSFYRKNLNLNA